jgi:ComF family protein
MLSPVREFAAGLLDLVYPPQCLTCGALDGAFCNGCRLGIVRVEEGAPVPAGIADARCAGFHEGPLRKAVLRLKFERKTALAAPLGGLMALEMDDVMGVWQPDALVPVPIHWTRRWDRGFNQSELLAREVSRSTRLPVQDVLRRTRATHPQVGLAGAQRRRNLRGAFAVDPRASLQGAWIVLVDDVRTTGATLGECAAALRGAGAAEVFALTVSFEA